MFNGKKTKKNAVSYGIVGLGRFGSALAHELAASGADLLVVDGNEEAVREARDYTEYAYVAKSYDKKTLSETGIQNCDMAVVCISEQMDTSILTVLHLVSMGIPTVIAEATSTEHGEILEKLGAEVVYPERDMAIRLAHRLETSKTLDYVQLSEQVNISKLMIPEGIVGKTVLDTDFRKRFGVNIIAIENGKTVLDTVKPDYVFRKGDILFVSGGKEHLSRLLEWAEEKKA